LPHRSQTKEQHAMQVTPYLSYNGNCEAAFKFYAQALDATIDVMMTYESAPAGMPIPPDWKQKIMYGRLEVDGGVIMASDAPPDRFRPAQGFSVSLLIENPAEAERRFEALSAGGSVTVPFGKTFFARGFGTCVDQFGIPWMVNCPLDE
jgi:PhnB protein